MTYSMEPSGPTGDRAPGPAPWHWRLLDAQGAEVSVAETGIGDGPRFNSQEDAESWLGQGWHELVDQGVASVILLESDHEVYGPMSLSA